jgi:hypothetical protein
VVLPDTAAAAAAAVSHPPPEGHPDLEVLCHRVGAESAETRQLITQLRADASTAGSIAWLEAQITTAREAGRQHLADALLARLELRRQRLELLLEKARALDETARRCAQAGFPVGRAPVVASDVRQPQGSATGT